MTALPAPSPVAGRSSGADRTRVLAPSSGVGPLADTAGRLFFGLGVIGIASTHFLFGQFTMGRAPAWPASIPGGTAWAYATGVMFVLVGLSVLTKRKTREAAVGAAVVVFVWALLRHLPIIAADTFLAPSWTPAGKALTFFGGLLGAAGVAPHVVSGARGWLRAFVSLDAPFVAVSRVCLAIFLMITGVQHFLYTEFVASLIPTWFPGNAVMWTQFAGVALIAGGAGQLVPRTAPLAALLSGLMVFSWFWIVHLPRSLGGISDRIAVFEALAVSGIALTIAGYLMQPPRRA